MLKRLLSTTLRKTRPVSQASAFYNGFTFVGKDFKFLINNSKQPPYSDFDTFQPKIYSKPASYQMPRMEAVTNKSFNFEFNDNLEINNFLPSKPSHTQIHSPARHSIMVQNINKLREIQHKSELKQGRTVRINKRHYKSQDTYIDITLEDTYKTKQLASSTLRSIQSTNGTKFETLMTNLSPASPKKDRLNLDLNATRDKQTKKQESRQLLIQDDLQQN